MVDMRKDVLEEKRAGSGCNSGQWLTMAMIGDVELLEAVTTYFEVFPAGRRSICETTAELHEWLLRGMTILSLLKNPQRTDVKCRGVIRSRTGYAGCLYICSTQKFSKDILPNASMTVLSNFMSESSHSQTPSNATPLNPSQ